MFISRTFVCFLMKSTKINLSDRRPIMIARWKSVVEIKGRIMWGICVKKGELALFYSWWRFAVAPCLDLVQVFLRCLSCVAAPV